jgi:hypothetical protein
MIVMNQGEIISDGPSEKILLEENIKEIGIGVPKIIQLYEMLKDAGLPFEKIPLSPPELAQMIQNMK